MPNRAIDCLREVRAFAPPKMVPDAAWSGVGHRLKRLPDDFSAFYVECRLSPASKQIDLLAGTRCTSYRDLSRAERDGAGDRSAVSRHISLLTKERIARPGRQVWFEFDDVGGPQRGAGPRNVHVCVDDAYARSFARRLDEHPFNAARAISTVQELRRIDVLTADATNAVLRCVRELPPGGRVIHVSSMAARKPAQTKLYVALPAGNVLGYLGRIGWSCTGRDRATALRAFAGTPGSGNPVFCDVTLTPGSAPSLAIVLSQWQVLAGSDDPTRRAARRRLLRARLCTETQSEAMAAWMREPEAPPLQFGGRARVRRWLDLKVQFRPDSTLAAKAYFGFSLETRSF